MAERPKLLKIDPEMQRWCDLLQDELSEWPGVTSKPMFGLTGFYHDGRIFAALPRTKAAGTPRSIIVKLSKVNDQRLKPVSGPGTNWRAFELESAEDINEALTWLGRAYEGT